MVLTRPESLGAWLGPKEGEVEEKAALACFTVPWGHDASPWIFPQSNPEGFGEE